MQTGGISKPPSNTAFKQQRLKACQPIFTPMPVILILLVVGSAFIVIGAILLADSQSLIEVTVRYDNKCIINSTCAVSLPIPETMKPPLYFYYKLENFYQNHRRYTTSRADNQLSGDLITSTSQISTCDPEKTLNNDDKGPILLPCGLVAGSLFNDTFELRTENGTVVPWTSDGIAWKSDLDRKFKNPPAKQLNVSHYVVVPFRGAPVPEYTDPEFVNWMRTAALPTFKKLYRIINTAELPKGNYTVLINNDFPVKSFSGKKYVVISEISWMGGKNDFLGVTYIVVASICLVFALSFFIAVRLRPRSLGDITGVKRFETHQ